MHTKTKFERWTAIAYNSYNAMLNDDCENVSVEVFLKNHSNKNIVKNAKDLTVRVNQLLNVKNNVPTSIGSVKNKYKKHVK